MPTLRLAVLAVTVTVPGAVPLAGVRVSHATFDDAVQLNVPPPELVIFNDCVAGLLPPTMPLNARLAGLQAIQGA